MLQRGTHLHLEADLVEFGEGRVIEERLGDAAYIVQRAVAEAVDVVHLALVDAVFPVDLEQVADHRRNLVDLVAVERDDAGAQDVGQVHERAVLARLAFELARETVFRLDARLDGIDVDVVRRDAIREDLLHHLEQFLVGRMLLAVFFENHGLPGRKPVVGHFFLFH